MSEHSETDVEKQVPAFDINLHNHIEELKAELINCPNHLRVHIICGRIKTILLHSFNIQGFLANFLDTVILIMGETTPTSKEEYAQLQTLGFNQPQFFSSIREVECLEAINEYFYTASNFIPTNDDGYLDFKFKDGFNWLKEILVYARIKDEAEKKYASGLIIPRKGMGIN